MEQDFRPEFLNRLDDIIVFRSLTEDDLKQIVDIELAKVAKRLKEKGLKLVLTDEAKEFLIEKGSNPEFGARPLRRAIEHHARRPARARTCSAATFDGKDTITVAGRRGRRREEAGLRGGVDTRRRRRRRSWSGRGRRRSNRRFAASRSRLEHAKASPRGLAVCFDRHPSVVEIGTSKS